MKNNWTAFSAETKTIPAFFIRRAQRRLGFKGTAANQTHVGLINIQTGVIYEALGSGVEKTNVEHYHNKGWKINLLENIPLPVNIEEKAIKLSRNENKQREYDFSLITGLLLFSFGLPKKTLDYFNKSKKFICTEFLSEIIGKEIYLPADFWTINNLLS